MSADVQDPAVTCYSLRRGWRDFWAVLLASLDSLGSAMSRVFEGFDWDKHWWTLPYRLGAATGLALIGGSLALSLSAAQAVLLACVASIRLAATGSMWAIEWLWRWYWRIFCVCPVCGDSSTLPAFACPDCGLLHRRLVPNHHGILWHRCRCGCQLPSSMFSGRSNLAAFCPFEDCRAPITHPERTPVVIALGACPGHGKTNFLCRSLQSLVNQEPGKSDWQLSWPEGEVDRFSDLEAQYARNAVRGTPNDRPVAWRLQLKSPRRAVDRMLHIFDPGGEAFHQQGDLNGHAYYAAIAGAVFIIDPFSLPSVQAACGLSAEALASVRPAEDNVKSGFETLLAAIDNRSRLGPRRLHKVALAIVITKLDAQHVVELVRASAPGQSDHEQGLAFLLQQGLGWMLQQTTHYFLEPQIFLSGRGDGNAPVPDGAQAFVWMIDGEQSGAASIPES